MFKHFSDTRTRNYVCFLVVCAVLDSFTHTSFSKSHMIKTIQLFSMLLVFPMLMLLLGQQESRRKGGFEDVLGDAGTAFILYFALKIIRNLFMMVMGGQANWMLLKDQTQLSLFWMGGAYMLMGPFIKKHNKTLLLLASIALAVLTGWLPISGQILGIFRILHFLPFFIMGFMVDMEVVQKIIRNYFWLLFSLTTIFILCLLLYWENKVLFALRPILLGTKKYKDLGKYASLGPVLRLGWYPLIVMLGLNTFTFMPGRKIALLEKHRLADRALQIMYLCSMVFLPYRKILEKTAGYVPNSIIKVVYLLGALVFCFVFGRINLDFIFRQNFFKRWTAKKKQ